MTTAGDTIYPDVAFEDITKIVSALETEICDMLSDPVLHPAKLRKTLAQRNHLIERYKRRNEESLEWAEERLPKRAGQGAER